MNVNPKLEASRLINDYALKSAALEAATADIKAELAALTAMLNKASAPHAAELEKIEAEAKALALEHGPAIFGNKRSLIENGYKLSLTATDEVDLGGTEDDVCRRIKRALAAALPEDEHERLALNALLNVTVKLNRTYVRNNYDESPAWFEQYGLSLVQKDSASLKKAPPPREKKAVQNKAKGTEAQDQEKEAA